MACAHLTYVGDVQLVGTDVFAALSNVDLITAGWECQGHSRAGHGKGLLDRRSSLFYDLVRIIKLCQHINNQYSCYLLELVNSSNDIRASVVDFETMRYILGPKVVTDVARHNSCAHRVRAF